MAKHPHLHEYESYSEPNWDSDGAQAITPRTLSTARALMDLFHAQMPDAAPGADGSIGFEWVSNCSGDLKNKIFLDVHDDKISFYCRINGRVFTRTSTVKAGE